MQTVLWVLIAVMMLLNLFTVYIGVMFLFAFKKRTPHPKTAPDARFAVIVPARNEAHVVGNLISALRNQNYPSENVDIFVAINNTTDDTAAVARAAGATVIDCVGKITCKGQVLHQAIEKILPLGHDAFVVFDADNIPDPDFLQRINDAFAAGERVCKGRLKAGNYAESWVSGGYGLYHALLEWTYSLPHTNAGFSSNLVGTAFAFHREVIEKMGGWNTVTLCEDTEFAAQVSRIGYRVAFIPEALSYDEQVPSFLTSLRQRHRWCYGMIQSARLMTKSMFSRSCPKKGMARDFGMLFIVSHTAPIAGIIGSAAMFFQPPEMLLLMAAALPLLVIVLWLLALFLCKYGGYPVRPMLPAILGFPLFLASWAPIQLYALIVPVKEWSEIRHSGQGDV